MKKEKTVLINECDFCGKDEHVYYECTFCKKHICSACMKSNGKELKPGVFWGGSGEGFICIDCLGKPELKQTEVYRAYKTIENLKIEYKIWHEDFKKICDYAESKLETILKRGE